MFEIVSVTKLAPKELSSIDLRKEALAASGEAYRVEIADRAQAAEVLIVGDRAGVAWGADATWIDLRSGETAEDAARIVLNVSEETARRA